MERRIRLVDVTLDEGGSAEVPIPFGWLLLSVHPWRTASGALRAVVVLAVDGGVMV